MKIPRIQPGPNQESVWDYPRPAIAEATSATLRVEFEGQTIAETTAAIRVLETSHPPTYYIPPEDVIRSVLSPNPHRSLCEWKGQARYFDLTIDNRSSELACWSYTKPTRAFRSIEGFIAFYPSRVDACFLNGERVRAQAGDFYGG
ncbi:MAG: DUF427 domain-containing protein, partial [Pseudomonadota bacterium]